MEVDREEADQDRHDHADDRGDHRASEGTRRAGDDGQAAVDDRSDDGCDAIDSLPHDERHLPGEDIAEDATTDAGEDADEAGEEHICTVACIDRRTTADDDERGEADRIGDVQDEV